LHGCGLVTFSTRLEAANAIRSLHGIFKFPGARTAMVAEWMDPTKQHRKARTHFLMALQPGQQLLFGGLHSAHMMPAALQPQMHPQMLQRLV
jgi:hypothetical protein